MTDWLLLSGPESQSGKVNHYLRLTPNTHTHTLTQQFTTRLRGQRIHRGTHLATHTQPSLPDKTLSTSVNSEEAPEDCLISIPAYVCVCVLQM